MEIVNVEDELGGVGGVGGPIGGPIGDSRLALPALERDNVDRYAAFAAHYGNSGGGGGGGGGAALGCGKNPLLNSAHEPLLFKSPSKENVQETQI